MRSAVPSGAEDAFDEISHALKRAEKITGELDHELAPPTRRRAVAMAVLFVLSVVVLAGVVAYFASAAAFSRAAEHTDKRVAVLESDLQHRRSAAAAQDAQRDAQIAELRRLVCVFADRSQPRDKDVEDVRRQYGCTGEPSQSPDPTSGGTAPPATAAARGGAGPATPGAAGPQPTVAPPPVSPKPGQTGAVCVDLPLLPRVCV